MRPEAVAALAAAGRTSWARPTARPPVKQVVGRIRAGLTDLFSLPDGWEVVLGNGGTTLFWDVATFGLIERRSQHLSFRRVLGQVRRRGRSRPPSRRPRGRHRRRRHPPTPSAEAVVDTYALTHNETSTGVAMGLEPAGCDADGLVRRRRHLGRRRAAVEPGRGRRLLLRPAEVLRRPTAGCGWPLCSPAAVDRIETISRSGRWMPARRSTWGSRSRTAASTRPTTPPPWPRCSCSTTSSSWMLGQRRPRVVRRPLRHVGGHHLRLGRRRAPSPRRSSTDPAMRSNVVGTIDLDGVDANDRGRRPAAQRHRRHRVLPQARAQPAPRRHVPRHRPRRRRRPHPLHRPRGGRALAED